MRYIMTQVYVIHVRTKYVYNLYLLSCILQVCMYISLCVCAFISFFGLECVFVL